jgi:hypothetical protein
MTEPPFRYLPGRHDTWEIVLNGQPRSLPVLDSIPTETAAENITVELNRAYQRGYRDAQDEIKRVLSIHL